MAFGRTRQAGFHPAPLRAARGKKGRYKDCFSPHPAEWEGGKKEPFLERECPSHSPRLSRGTVIRKLPDAGRFVVDFPVPD